MRAHSPFTLISFAVNWRRVFGAVLCACETLPGARNGQADLVTHQMRSVMWSCRGCDFVVI